MRLTDALKQHFRNQVSIPDTDFNHIVKESDRNAISFALRAIKQGLLDRQTAGTIIGESLGCSYINLDQQQFDNDIVCQLNLIEALTLQAIPIKDSEENIILATDNPSALDRSKLPKHLIRRFKVMFTFPDELEAAIADQYQRC